MAWLMRQQQLRSFHAPESRFTPFSRFPAEIQDKIWEEAMRGNTNCFHAFYFKPFNPATSITYSSKCTIYTYGYNCDTAQEEWAQAPQTTKAIIEQPNGLGVFQLYRVPASLRSACWHYLNESMYLEDAGLWSATRGPRASMTKKHLMPPQHWAATAASAPLPASKTFSAAVTGSFVNHNERITFHIAKQDIVCIQCDWRSNNVLHFGQFSGSIFSAFQGVDNFAVEFDRWMLTDLHLKMSEHQGILGNVLRRLDGTIANAAWPLAPNSPILQLLRARARIEGARPKLWFIDLSLKRSGVPAANVRLIRPDRAVFDGKFCRFVEVQFGDCDWEWNSPGFHPAHRCFTTGFFLPECGGQCLINTIAQGFIRNNFSDAERLQVMDWVARFEFGVLAVENKTLR